MGLEYLEQLIYSHCGTSLLNHSHFYCSSTENPMCWSFVNWFPEQTFHHFITYTRKVYGIQCNTLLYYVCQFSRRDRSLIVYIKFNLGLIFVNILSKVLEKKPPIFQIFFFLAHVKWETRSINFSHIYSSFYIFLYILQSQKIHDRISCCFVLFFF